MERVTELAQRLRRRVIPAVPVPFEGRRIDRDAQRAYASWMAGQGAGGVALWAHTGRGLRLTPEQRMDVLSDWRSAAPGLPVICGVGIPHGTRLPSAPAARTKAIIAQTLRLAEEARDGGASAVMLHPPGALRTSKDRDRRILAVHEALAGVGLPVIAFYLYEAAGGIAYSRDLVAALVALDHVAGIKLATLDSVMTFQDLAAVVLGQPRALLITGEDRFLGYSLMLGAHSALIGMAAACTHAMVGLLDAWFDGDLARFHQLSAAVDRFSRATFVPPMEGYVQRMLWALEADEVLDTAPRDPFAPALSRGDRENVARAVAAFAET